MDQDDDPEKRVADLEHQLAQQERGAYRPPVQPPRQANAAWGMGRVFAAILTAVVALVGLSYGVNDFLAYRQGTPTTATISGCSGGRGGNYSCEGTWGIDGVTQTGPFNPGFSTPHNGSTVDVRVSDGSAYQEGSWLPGFAVGGVFLLASISVVFSGRRGTGRG